MWPFPLLVWASHRAAGAAQVLCCALCCRAWGLAVKWYYSQGSSTAASKEIRIDTRSARKRGRGQHQCWSQCCVASLGHPSAKHILDVSSAPPVVTAMSCQHQRISDPGENVNVSIFQLNFVIISFLPPAPEYQNIFALISISCSSVLMQEML